MKEYYVEFNDGEAVVVHAKNEQLAVWETMYQYDVRKVVKVVQVKPMQPDIKEQKWFIKASARGRSTTYILHGEKEDIIHCLKEMHPDIVIHKMELML